MVLDKSSSPGQLAWRRFRRNYLAVSGGIFLLLCVFIGLFSYFLMPDASTNANFQSLEFARKPPGTKAVFLLKARPLPEEKASGFFSVLWNGKPDLFEPIPVHSLESIRIQNDSIYYVSFVGLKERKLLSTFLTQEELRLSGLAQNQTLKSQADAFLNKNSSPANPNEFLANHVLVRKFYLGTDGYGRDVLSRLILGTSVSLSVGFLAVLISLIVGIFLGAIAGFFGGWTDSIVMWFTSVIWSIPTLLLAISLTFIWEKGFWQVFIAIGLSMWVEVARIVRGQILFIREMQYIEASKSLGYSSFRTIFVHVVPNVLNPVIIIAAANFASAILVEAGLSCLGVGVQAPVPSWGGMIREGYTFIIFDSGKWLALVPGIAIVLVVISLNLFGFGLRDALDPKASARL